MLFIYFLEQIASRPTYSPILRRNLIPVMRFSVRNQALTHFSVKIQTALVGNGTGKGAVVPGKTSEVPCSACVLRKDAILILFGLAAVRVIIRYLLEQIAPCPACCAIGWICHLVLRWCAAVEAEVRQVGVFLSALVTIHRSLLSNGDLLLPMFFMIPIRTICYLFQKTACYALCSFVNYTRVNRCLQHIQGKYWGRNTLFCMKSHPLRIS